MRVAEPAGVRTAERPDVVAVVGVAGWRAEEATATERAAAPEDPVESGLGDAESVVAVGTAEVEDPGNDSEPGEESSDE